MEDRGERGDPCVDESSAPEQLELLTTTLSLPRNIVVHKLRRRLR